MTGFCPHCGTNLTADEPVTRGAWSVAPTEVYHDGERVPVTVQQAGFLHTLARAFPRSVQAETIGQRISTTEWPHKLANVTASQIRKRLPDPPFETVHGAGYRWMALEAK